MFAMATRFPPVAAQLETGDGKVNNPWRVTKRTEILWMPETMLPPAATAPAPEPARLPNGLRSIVNVVAEGMLKIGALLTLYCVTEFPAMVTSCRATNPWAAVVV